MRQTALLWLLVVSLIGISDTLKCCRSEMLEASNASRWSPVSWLGIAGLLLQPACLVVCCGIIEMKI